MDNSMRIVTKIPLSEIWKFNQDIVSNRKHYLNEEQINNILQISKVDFIVADVGLHLHWVGTELCFDIWNNEIKNHLIITFYFHQFVGTKANGSFLRF
jgi:hypothetical protein